MRGNRWISWDSADLVEMMGASPTARALHLLEMLQARPGITARDLSERLGVSTRAVRRYVAILREADIPIDSTRGPHGGYRLGRGARVPPLVFTAGEALGLVMAVLDGHHAAADPDDLVGAALGKLIRALPGATGEQAARMRNHARAAPDPRASRPDPVITSALVDAVAGQRRVRLEYVTGAGSPIDTVVDPWAVVVRHGRWYLLCHAHRPDAARSYRIDRIGRLTPLNARADEPPEIDPVGWLEHHLGSGWEYETHVVFDAPIEEVREWVTPPMGTLESTSGGDRCVLRGSTSNPVGYAGEWLAGIPFPCHVAGGPELREAVADVARRLTAAVRQL